jgi:hypothetical protein
MSFLSSAVGPAAALFPLSLHPEPSALVIVAGGGRDLAWPVPLIARELLAHAHGLPVHQLLHGGARGADQAIALAADQLGWPIQALPADWRRFGRGAGPIRNRQLLEEAIRQAQGHSTPHSPAGVLVVAFPGGAGTASLLQLARQRVLSSPVPLLVIEVAPAPSSALAPA